MPVRVHLDRLPAGPEHTRLDPCKSKHGRSKCEMAGLAIFDERPTRRTSEAQSLFGEGAG